MQFAYIDSQGKEVRIPSVDALRLRIELGAITDRTHFHDANTGKWAPAVEHEVYRMLRRELEELDPGGFIAPPPPAPGAEVEAEGSDGAFELGFTVEPTSLDTPSTSEPPPPPAAEPPPPPSGPPSEMSGPPPGFESGARMPGLEEDGDLEGGDADSEDAEDDLEAGGSTASPPAGRGPWWEEGPDQDEAAGAGPGPSGIGPDRFPEEDPGDLRADGDPEPRESRFQSRLEPGEEGQLPDWMRQERPADWADAPAWDGPESGASEDQEEAGPDPFDPGGDPVHDARRPRRAPPPRKLRRAGTPGAGRVAAIALVAVTVGAGVWILRDRIPGLQGWGGGDESGQTALPTLPDALAGRLPALVGEARANALDALETLPEFAALPAAPNRDWLTGAYLASASSYRDVAGYWEAVLAFARAAVPAEDRAFRGALRAGVEALELTGEERTRLLARALAGWGAAAEARARAHGLLASVASASLELHGFLLENEDRIESDRAAGGLSRDPVLEAVPATPELGDVLWSRVGAVTGALDRLGFLETVTTSGLLQAHRARLLDVPVP
ncbi:MAG: hypothetical protein RQ751_06850 [Longimicrobiales bacterium]|nr:hypothetical protein [Longimicrobiales bacterium]